MMISTQDTVIGTIITRDAKAISGGTVAG